ncbi:hypothetical protein Scep_000165 [Stephania cephalantha]|uniref:Uncharacterized protein n=1 Tax=Stephania cephalantha TaxID=152367 RepID=A0AAP0L990_9MAGN
MTSSSPLRLIKTSYHTRSVSLHSRPSPLTVGVEQRLQRLRSSQDASTSSQCSKLSGLRDVYDCVDDLLHLPHTTLKALSSQLRSEEGVNGVLDGSLRVLDVCNTTRDVLMEMKKNVQDLLSSLRRKRGGEAGLADDVKEYMVCQKKLNKIVHKCVEDLKKMESKHVSSFSLLEEDPNVVAIVGSLREVNAITTSIFKSILSSISHQPRKSSSWSLASKLMNKKRQGEDTDQCFNDVEKADAALSELMSSSKSCKDTQNALKRMEALDMNIHGLEDEMDCVFRSLIKTRVTLLNGLNH